MTYRLIRVRRDALPLSTQVNLTAARIGDRVDLTVYGVPSKAVITELNLEWVEFRSGDLPVISASYHCRRCNQDFPIEGNQQEWLDAHLREVHGENLRRDQNDDEAGQP